MILLQGILVPKLTLGPLSVRNGPIQQRYLFQELYIYKSKPGRTKLHQIFIKNG